ncbi:MAG TPA: hypothetical protein VML55_22275 [Planctomycetaceae bacterium]|nr:hypothetical protein [Planctomycetaceae bacterium]
MQNNPLDVREQLARFVDDIRRRNIRETVAAALVAVLFGWRLVARDHLDLAALGPAIIVLGALEIAAVTWTMLHIPRSELAAFPPEGTADHWRGRLSVQARMLKLAWLWYALPIFVGLSLNLWARSSELSVFQAAMFVLVAALFAGVSWMNFHAGRQIERQRDEWFPTR